MTDVEKVIKGLECCTTQGFGCIENKKCPYGAQRYGSHCVDSMLRDAIALLKAQEPVEPTWRLGYAYCGECGFHLHWIVEKNNYCPECGRAVKWDG